MTVRLVTLLERHGVRVESLGFRRADLCNPEARVDVADVDHLLEVAASVRGAPGLARELAAIVDADTYDAAGRLMLSGRTLRESYALAFEHQRLWGDTRRFSLRGDSRALRIGFEHSGASPLAKAVLGELALLEAMAGAKLLVGPQAAAIGVRFAHEPLGDVADLETAFGCEIVFGARRNELLLPLALADAPVRPPADLLRTLFERDALLAQAKIPDASSVVARARAASHDWPTLSELARRMGLSTRSLQRKLREERSSYFEVIDALRRECVERLTAQGLSHKRVALEIGYGDPRALARALKRWEREKDEDRQ